MNTFTLDKDDYPLVYGGNVANTSGGYNSSESRYRVWFGTEYK